MRQEGKRIFEGQLIKHWKPYIPPYSLFHCSLYYFYHSIFFFIMSLCFCFHSHHSPTSHFHFSPPHLLLSLSLISTSPLSCTTFTKESAFFTEIEKISISSSKMLSSAMEILTHGVNVWDDPISNVIELDVKDV